MESPACAAVRGDQSRACAAGRRRTSSISLSGLAEKTAKLTALAPGKPAVVDYPLDTSLRPDAYRVAARISVAGPEPYESQEELTVRIVPRQPPYRFPVLMWGGYSPQETIKEMPRLREIGFNHVLGVDVDTRRSGKPADRPPAGTPASIAETKHMLDEALANDMTIVASLSPASTLFDDPEFSRVDRQGRPRQAKNHDVCGLIPRIQQFCYNVGRLGRPDVRRLPGLRRGLAAHGGPRSAPSSASTSTTSRRFARRGHRHAARGAQPLRDCPTGRSPISRPTA